MLDRAQTIEKLKTTRQYLDEHYGVHSMTLFGSLARNEQREDSDVDICNNKYYFQVFSTYSDEGNVCTTTQVEAAKAKGWIAQYYDTATNQWLDYEGSSTDGINGLEINIYDSTAPIYNLGGQRLKTFKKGVNIIGGKKVIR